MMSFGFHFDLTLLVCFEVCFEPNISSFKLCRDEVEVRSQNLLLAENR